MSPAYDLLAPGHYRNCPAYMGLGELGPTGFPPCMRLPLTEQAQGEGNFYFHTARS